MAKFRVEVTVKAECTYTVEVEAPSEREAEDRAGAMWREKTPEDFQVDKGYITNWEGEVREQLTFDCEHCGAEFGSRKEMSKDDPDYCVACAAEMDAEQAEWDRKHAAKVLQAAAQTLGDS